MNLQSTNIFGIELNVLILWKNQGLKVQAMGHENKPEGTPDKKLKINEYIFHDENPFISQVIEHISTKRHRKVIGTKYQEVLSEDGSGELLTQKLLVLGDQKKVDKQEFYKIYCGAIQAFFGLSKGSTRLFEYVMDNITYNHDRICITPSDVKEKIDMSRSACYRGVLELLQAGIIAKAQREGCYFINPTMVFKGDRITLVNQYILDKKREKPALKMTERHEDPNDQRSVATGDK